MRPETRNIQQEVPRDFPADVEEAEKGRDEEDQGYVGAEKEGGTEKENTAQTSAGKEV